MWRNCMSQNEDTQTEAERRAAAVDRKFPPGVTLIRRDFRPSELPDTATLGDLKEWLIGDALKETDLLDLWQGFLWRLVATGFPLDRSSLHVGTLHPQLFGYAWNWDRDGEWCEEVKVGTQVTLSQAYLRSPLRGVLDRGYTVDVDPRDQEAVKDLPVVAELAERGFTQYIGLPLTAGGSHHNATTVATKQKGGFTEKNKEVLAQMLALLALHIERHIALRIAANALSTYLGQAAGRQVLEGSINRGDGENIRAIIWMSDLRGFTQLMGSLPGPDMLSLLNAYFEILAGAVMEEGGEVLKFIGDGLLAVFPTDAERSETSAAQAAVTAAEKAVSRLRDFNTNTDSLPGVEGWRPLKMGLALHYGNIFFGNVGSPARLDFTTIGPAVNVASRVEGLTKTLNRQILLTDAVASLLPRQTEDLGLHDLRGVKAPVRVFGI